MSDNHSISHTITLVYDIITAIHYPDKRSLLLNGFDLRI